MTADQVIDTPRNLSGYEEVIARGLQSFTEVGTALIAIRDGRLYRSQYPTFEDYCANRWGLARTRAYELIDAATTVREVSEISDIAPVNEGQAKALRGLEPKVAAEVMTEAAEAGKVTAASIKAAREKVAPKPVARITETHKTESFVDTETGEVTAKPAEWLSPTTIINQKKPAESSPVAQFLAADPEMQRSAYLVRFSAVVKAANFAQFLPADFVSVAGPDQYEAIDRVVEHVTRWRDAVLAERPTHLRRVQ